MKYSIRRGDSTGLRVETSSGECPVVRNHLSYIYFEADGGGDYYNTVRQIILEHTIILPTFCCVCGVKSDEQQAAGKTYLVLVVAVEV